ncbi:unnamed protein product, partial [Rotaria magnacalcarata]
LSQIPNNKFKKHKHNKENPREMAVEKISNTNMVTNGDGETCFIDQANQTIGSTSSIEPVLDADRGSLTALLFRQTTGLIPVGTRSVTVLANFIRYTGTYSNGYADNIGGCLYQWR